MVKKCLQIQHIQESEQDNGWAIQHVSVYVGWIKAWRKRQVSVSILRNVLSEQYKCLYGNCLAKLSLKVSNIGENWLYIQGYDLRLQQHLYIEI